MSLRGPSELGSTCYCVATLAENSRPMIDGHINPTRFRLFKAFVGGRLMLDKKELRRLARLHRLARQIAASLPAEISSTHALRVDERTDQLLKWQHDGSLQPESASRRM